MLSAEPGLKEHRVQGLGYSLVADIACREMDLTQDADQGELHTGPGEQELSIRDGRCCLGP